MLHNKAIERSLEDLFDMQVRMLLFALVAGLAASAPVKQHDYGTFTVANGAEATGPSAMTRQECTGPCNWHEPPDCTQEDYVGLRQLLAVHTCPSDKAMLQEIVKNPSKTCYYCCKKETMPEVATYKMTVEVLMDTSTARVAL